MKLHADKGSGNYIQSVTVDTVVVSGQAYRVPVIISPGSIITAWMPPALADLALAHLAPALDLEPEVILLGTGTTHRFASNVLATAIMARGIGFEVMSTAAACRTYNVLNAEDRLVVAALLPA